MFGRQALSVIAVMACLTAAASVAGEGNRFCGGAVRQTVPSDLENVAGELTLEHSAQQPASLITCARGYLLEKCGDHEAANAVFDKCIAAGYVGAMIWKALMYENGYGVPQDDAKATELMRRAAMSADPGYATLGKLHYATALHLGKGVERNEAEARKWFQAAAAEADPDAAQFLRTGYHTGSRDGRGRGVGVPSSPVAGQKLDMVVTPPDAPSGRAVERLVTMLIAFAFMAGVWRQG
jgi:TPR repeat protein